MQNCFAWGSFLGGEQLNHQRLISLNYKFIFVKQ